MTIIVIIAVLALLGLIAVAAKTRRSPHATGAGADHPFEVDRHSEAPRWPLTIGVYNIHSGRGTDGKTDLARIANIVKGADIISMHEVRAVSGRVRSQGNLIAKHTGHGVLFAPTKRRYGKDHSGDALLSQPEILTWEREPLVDDTGSRFRVMTTTSVAVGTQRLNIVFTHLHTRGLRTEQLRRVFEQFAALPSPAILLGDLNTRPDDAQLKQLLASAPDAVDAIGNYIERGNPDQTRVDWIITRGLEIEEGGDIPVGASDHPYYWIRANVI